jgi:carboxypeptidase Taq
MRAMEQIPDLEEQIAAGNFSPLRHWLNEKIHRVGSLYANGDELMVESFVAILRVSEC